MSVCVFGSLNLDIALRLPTRAAWGHTLLVDAAEQAVGGKGLNQALAAARFGSLTRMAGAVGDDEAGRMLRAALESAGVDRTAVATLPGQASGRATILLEPAGDNMILVEPAANRQARAAQGLAAIDADSRVLLCQLETDIAEIERLLASPEAAPLRKIVNFAPAVPEGSRLFDLTDMLIFNQSEFAAFLQLDREPETPDDLLVARRLLSRPNQAVVVTLGAIGSAAVWAERVLFSPAFAVDAVVDTSGAGDCFCGVVAACVDQGIGPEAALRHANAAASLSVRAKGAAPSIPGREAIDQYLASTWG